MKLGALLTSLLTFGRKGISRESIVLSMSSLPEESVWDYPRPAICQPFDKTLSIEMKNGRMLVEGAKASYRTLETSHPPTYYIKESDINMKYLQRRDDRTTLCEWKGRASYYDLLDDDGNVIAPNVAWTYATPTEKFSPLVKHLSFYAQHFKQCTVDGEVVLPQDGDFYGGWITKNLKGPFKGAPGTMGW